MIIRKIPVYTFTTTQFLPLEKETFKNNDFVISLPLLKNFIGKEQTIFELNGAISVKIICRSLDINSKDETIHDLHRENCFIANETNEWILVVDFTTESPEGVCATNSVNLPLSLEKVIDTPLTLWFNGTWMRIILDGEVINENTGVGVLCNPDEINVNADVKVASVLEVKKSYRKKQEDVPADFYDPYGFNTNVGDVMAYFHDDTYHVLYLLDRRHHKSRNGAGAHYFAHLTTKDLIHWEEQEPINEIENPYETFGTGTMFFSDGKYYVSYGLHTSRYVSGKFGEPPFDEKTQSYISRTFDEVLSSGEMPLGASYSVSDDGISFKRSNVLFHGCQNPSIYKTEDGFTLFAGYGHEGTFTSKTPNGPYTKSPTQLTFRGPTTALDCSDECPAFFEMNGYKYLIVGFCGYFRSLEKNSSKMVDAIALGESVYDGLCVPMVAELPNNRRIIAGWLTSEFGWASVLVQRELVSLDNGRLGMKWISELYPEKIGDIILPQEDAFSLVPKTNYIYEGKVEVDDNGIFALRFFGENNLASELRIDVNKNKAQFSDALPNGDVTAEIPTYYEMKVKNGYYCAKFNRPNHNYMDNFALPDVRLNSSFELKILFRYSPKMRTTVCDVEMDGKHTLILNKPNFFINGIKMVCGKQITATITPIKR